MGPLMARWHAHKAALDWEPIVPCWQPAQLQLKLQGEIS